MTTRAVRNPLAARSIYHSAIQAFCIVRSIMAKKSRRPRSASPNRYSVPRPSAPPVGSAPATTAPTPASRPRGSAAEPARKVDFAEEYRYVYQDLRRVGILAGTILFILIVLSFVIK
jgi:hypothetical protein